MTETERIAVVDKMLAECKRDAKGHAVVPDDFFDEYFDLLPVGTKNESLKRMKGRTNNKLRILTSEDRDIQSAGGRASQAILKEKRTFRDAIIAALESVGPSGKTLREEVVDALVAKALDGCVGAFEALRDTSGEKPTEQVSMDIMTDGDRELMNNLMSRINDGD